MMTNLVETKFLFIKNTNCDLTQIVTKPTNSNWDKTNKNLNCDETKKNQIVT